jgi:hypothetical protein
MDMSAEISWVFEAAVKPDELDEYQKLAAEISADNEAAECSGSSRTMRTDS